jgi:dihydrofolate reductase
LVDELRIHLIPVLLGDGARLFDQMGPNFVELECTRVIEAPGATHLTFRLSG